MLTVTLRTLEADGLVSRTVYAEVPPRVEYQLTETGKTLIPHIESLVGWALEHMTGIFDSREKAGPTMRIVKIFYTEVFYDIFLSLSLRHKLKNNHLGKK